MPRYIDADSLTKRLCPYTDSEYAQDMEAILKIVSEEPTANVRPERHGEWKYKQGISGCYCSECGGFHLCEHKFCHWCGAKMDRGNQKMTDKPNKNCTHCLAYNIDHCAAKECKGVLTVLRHSQARRLPDEIIRKYYENMFRNDSSYDTGEVK